MIYSICGAKVSSEFPLENEPFAEGRPDIVIRKGIVPLTGMKRGKTSLLLDISRDRIRLHWDDVGSFSVFKGTEITVTPSPDADDKVFQRILSGSILAVALCQLGRFVLHSSAVVVNGGAFLFSGDSGYGKSTIASNLHACGFNLLADDIAAIQVGSDSHDVFPGNQEFKLWPDSIRILGENEENLRRFDKNAEKRLRPITERIQRDPVPLRRIYILSFGEKEGIEDIAPAQAAIELIRNMYGVTVLHEVRKAEIFQQAVSLAKSVPVFRLWRRRSLENFETFLTMVKKHIAGTD